MASSSSTSSNDALSAINIVDPAILFGAATSSVLSRLTCHPCTFICLMIGPYTANQPFDSGYNSFTNTNAPVSKVTASSRPYPKASSSGTVCWPSCGIDYRCACRERLLICVWRCVICNWHWDIISSWWKLHPLGSKAFLSKRFPSTDGSLMSQMPVFLAAGMTAECMYSFSYQFWTNAHSRI